MKLLITGAGGQLGRCLSELIAAGTSHLGPLPDCYGDAEVIATSREDLDISDFDNVLRFLEKHRPDSVFNCAAMSDVDGCEIHPDEAVKANSLGPCNLAVAASRTGGHLVHVSTDHVFSGEQDNPYREWDPCGPVNAYGKSKLLGEQFVRSLLPQSYIVRTSWLYGGDRNFVKAIQAKAAGASPLLSYPTKREALPMHRIWSTVCCESRLPDNMGFIIVVERDSVAAMNSH